MVTDFLSAATNLLFLKGLCGCYIIPEILSYTNEEFIAIPNNSRGTEGYKLYQVKMEIEERDEYYFIDTKVSRNGTISFHTMYNNGGTYWAELVEEDLK